METAFADVRKRRGGGGNEQSIGNAERDAVDDELGRDGRNKGVDPADRGQEAVQSPTTTPTKIPRSKARFVGAPWTDASAATTPASAKTAPMERSKPPAMNTIVSPHAMIPTCEDWSTTFRRLCCVKKIELAN